MAVLVVVAPAAMAGKRGTFTLPEVQAAVRGEVRSSLDEDAVIDSMRCRRRGKAKASCRVTGRTPVITVTGQDPDNSDGVDERIRYRYFRGVVKVRRTCKNERCRLVANGKFRTGAIVPRELEPSNESGTGDSDDEDASEDAGEDPGESASEGGNTTG